jgi:endonuclease III
LFLDLFTMNRNFEKVFSVFRKNYIVIPLEVFGKDPYKTLISTLLSSRTRDEITLNASKKLFKKAPNIRTLSDLDTKTLSSLIYPVGFYNTKAKNLKALAKMVLENFNGKIPKTREELIKLPGVGRKTANLVLNRAFNIPAIAVDTHVHRISNLLGWVKTKTPQETEKILTKILPKNLWPEVNKLFVSVGRQFPSKKKLTEFLNSLT